MKAAMKATAGKTAPMVEEPIMVEMAKPMAEENRTADKKRRPIEPGIPPVVLPGVRTQIGRRRRSRLALLREAGRILRRLPAAIRRLARLADGLLRPPSNRHLR